MINNVSFELLLKCVSVCYLMQRKLVGLCGTVGGGKSSLMSAVLGRVSANEPPRGKTNNVVSEQVRHKPSCTSTEDG